MRFKPNFLAFLSVVSTAFNLSSASAFFSNASFAPPAIYGKDDILESYQATSPEVKKIARATAAMIPSKLIMTNRTAFMPKYVQFCTKEDRFNGQPSTAACTGFLIGPDLLLTAGHCVESLKECKTNEWIFDYQMTPSGKAQIGINFHNYYTCKKIIALELDDRTDRDYAVVQLDRPVVGREPLEFRKSGVTPESSTLGLMGYPMGLPQKFMTGAKIMQNNLAVPFFTAELDAFQGNSGSPVFDDKTGLIEGILVRGVRDFIEDKRAFCTRLRRCTDEAPCKGEEVTRITDIPFLKMGYKDPIAAKWAVLNFDAIGIQAAITAGADFNALVMDETQKITALQYLVDKNQIKLIQLLIKGKADPYLKNALGHNAFDFVDRRYPTRAERHLRGDLYAALSGN